MLLKTIKMKKTIFFLIAIMFSFSTFAKDKKHEKENKKLVYIGFGLSKPIGQYGSTSANSTYSAYAKSGVGADIGFALPIEKSNFSCIFQLASSINAFNSSVYSQNVWATNASNNDLINVYSSSYVVRNAQLGLGYSLFKTSNRFNISVNAMAGIESFNFPNVTVSDYNLSTAKYSSSQISADKSYSFSYGGGTTIKYDLGKRLSALVKADYIASSPKLNMTLTQYDGSTQTLSYKQPTSIVLLIAALSYKF